VASATFTPVTLPGGSRTGDFHWGSFGNLKVDGDGDLSVSGYPFGSYRPKRVYGQVTDDPPGPLDAMTKAGLGVTVYVTPFGEAMITTIERTTIGQVLAGTYPIAALFAPTRDGNGQRNWAVRYIDTDGDTWMERTVYDPTSELQGDLGLLNNFVGAPWSILPANFRAKFMATFGGKGEPLTNVIASGSDLGTAFMRAPLIGATIFTQGLVAGAKALGNAAGDAFVKAGKSLGSFIVPGLRVVRDGAEAGVKAARGIAPYVAVGLSVAAVSWGAVVLISRYKRGRYY
jgi:hypothetical protein